MDNVVCGGLLTRRLFGGVAILWKNLDGIIPFEVADDGRVVCVELITNDVHLLIGNEFNSCVASFNNKFIQT